MCAPAAGALRDQGRGGTGSAGPTVSDSRIRPSRPWMRTSPPPALRASVRARSTASALVDAFALALQAPSLRTSQPSPFPLTWYRLLRATPRTRWRSSGSSGYPREIGGERKGRSAMSLWRRSIRSRNIGQAVPVRSSGKGCSKRTWSHGGKRMRLLMWLLAHSNPDSSAARISPRALTENRATTSDV